MKVERQWFQVKAQKPSTYSQDRVVSQVKHNKSCYALQTATQAIRHSTGDHLHVPNNLPLVFLVGFSFNLRFSSSILWWLNFQFERGSVIIIFGYSAGTDLHLQAWHNPCFAESSSMSWNINNDYIWLVTKQVARGETLQKPRTGDAKNRRIDSPWFHTTQCNRNARPCSSAP